MACTQAQEPNCSGGTAIPISTDSCQCVVGILVFRAHEVEEANAATARQVRELLHLNPDAQEFRLVFGVVPHNDKEISVLTRSMMEILAEASAGVEIPASDVDEGRVMRMGVSGAPSEVGPRFLIRVRRF